MKACTFFLFIFTNSWSAEEDANAHVVPPQVASFTTCLSWCSTGYRVQTCMILKGSTELLRKDADYRAARMHQHIEREYLTRWCGNEWPHEIVMIWVRIYYGGFLQAAFSIAYNASICCITQCHKMKLEEENGGLLSWIRWTSKTVVAYTFYNT